MSSYEELDNRGEKHLMVCIERLEAKASMLRCVLHDYRNCDALDKSEYLFSLLELHRECVSTDPDAILEIANGLRRIAMAEEDARCKCA